MPSAAWRLLWLPLLLFALLLVGMPNFPAWDRTVSKLFVPPTPTAESAPSAEPRDSRAAPPPSDSARRPRILVPLYASFAALQALDAHSTLAALHAGHREANPLMRGIADRPAALLAVKAAVACTTIYVAEKVRARSQLAAIALMAALNSVYATIVVRNYVIISK